MSIDLTDKVAVVTGGATNLGAAMARDLAERGASVVVADHNAKKLSRLVDAIRRAGGTAESYPIELDEPEAIDSMVAFAALTYGRVHFAVIALDEPARLVS